MTASHLPKPCLNELAQAFTDWRSQRSNREETPYHLKQKALNALPFHTQSAIIQAAGINYNTLKKWQNSEHSTPAGQFVRVLPSNAPKDIELSFSNQQHSVSLRGAFSIDELQSLIPLLQGCTS